MSKPTLPLIEFYITNVCNFNCDNCNRLNNYHFSGHQLWKDYAEIYKEWSTKIDVKQLTILGGEPLLNPSLLDWVAGIRLLWPNSELELLTNGTRLKFWPELYNVLKDNKVKLVINSHNSKRHDSILEEITKMLQEPISKKYQGDLSNWRQAYLDVKDSSWPDCKSANEFKNLPKHIQVECQDIHGIDPEKFVKNTNDLHLIDVNGVQITVTYSNGFITAPLRYAGDNQFEVYNSDPEKAHNACISKYCHHFVRGKLYKCHHVALLPEFLEQFKVNLLSEDQKLLESYQPLTVDQSEDDFQKFVDNIRGTIPQCKLCPSKLETILLQASTNKPKIIKFKKMQQ
jgi:organic radical activating enzyme